MNKRIFAMSIVLVIMLLPIKSFGMLSIVKTKRVFGGVVNHLNKPDQNNMALVCKDFHKAVYDVGLDNLFLSSNLPKGVGKNFFDRSISGKETIIAEIFFKAVEDQNHSAVENILQSIKMRNYYKSIYFRQVLYPHGIARYKNDEKMLEIFDKYYCDDPYKNYGCEQLKPASVSSIACYFDDSDYIKDNIRTQDEVLQTLYHLTYNPLSVSIKLGSIKCIKALLDNQEVRNFLKNTRYGKTLCLSKLQDVCDNEVLELLLQYSECFDVNEIRSGMSLTHIKQRKFTLLDDLLFDPIEWRYAEKIVLLKKYGALQIDDIKKAILENKYTFTHALLTSIKIDSIECIVALLNNQDVRDYLKTTSDGKQLGRDSLKNACDFSSSVEVFESLLKSECFDVNEIKSDKPLTDIKQKSFTLLDDLLGDSGDRYAPYIALLKKYGALQAGDAELEKWRYTH